MTDYQETTTEISYTEYNADLKSLNKASYQKSNDQSSSLPDGYNLFVKPVQGGEIKVKMSDCSGKKKALLIGINYIGTQFELKGCINDVQRIKKFLIEHGFNESDMIILTDDQRDRNKIPTRENITKYIKELVSDPQKNDSYFFHFSGHGGQLADKNEDEEDGYDETILPLDWQKAGQIIDDELHHLLVDPLPEGVRLTVVFDSCHSGTVLDLPYVYSTRGTIKQPKILLQGAKSVLNTGLRFFQGELESLRESAKLLATKAMSGHVIRRKNLETLSSTADIVMFSGCKDEQTSADAHEGGQATGAMSFALIKSLSRDHKQTYKELLNSIRDILREKYAQRPQLSASHPMEMESPFTI
ncbi:hypothetical protein Glove_241g10 [Diversispora epigaea]|uniref:Peptidase C14 caspase domain-containing protein n=1 Tax=Diversispora epigaea TaxID=1348612 RepID=A0A397IAQ3_9GLOM|nr:hypothetical protein Glove_241g10 [Diversispora epigaea]